MMVCIDAGHGGKDPGAVSGDWHESFFTLDIARGDKFSLVNFAASVLAVTSACSIVGIIPDS